MNILLTIYLASVIFMLVLSVFTLYHVWNGGQDIILSLLSESFFCTFMPIVNTFLLLVLLKDYFGGIEYDWTVIKGRKQDDNQD